MASPLCAALHSLQHHLDRVASEIRELSQKTEKLAALVPGQEPQHLRLAALPENKGAVFETNPLPGQLSESGSSLGKRSASGSNMTSPDVSLSITGCSSVGLRPASTVPHFVTMPSFATDGPLKSESLPPVLMASIMTDRRKIAETGHNFRGLKPIKKSTLKLGLTLDDRTRNGRVFADAATHISTMQEEMMAGSSEQQDAQQYYHDAGHIFADIVRSHAFQGLSFSMVAFSSIWMAIEIDTSDVSMLHVVMGHVLCSYFALELLVQLLAFKDKKNVAKDTAFMFDLLLVFLVVLETWMIPMVHLASGTSGGGGNMRIALIFRLLRFLKVLRLGKVLRQLPELLIIVRGILMAYKAISFTILLLAMIVYAGGLVFRVLLDGTALGEERFSTVPMAMGTLLIEATLSGSKGGQLLREAYSMHAAHAALMLLYVVLANITMMGVLGGLLVQAVKTVTEFEKAHIDFVGLLKDLNEIWDLALTHDDDGDNCISLPEFEGIMTDKDSVAKLKSADVDVESLVMCSGFIFQHYTLDGNLTRQQFMQCVLDHRGKQSAKVKDHVQTRRYLHAQLQAILPVAPSAPPTAPAPPDAPSVAPTSPAYAPAPLRSKDECGRGVEALTASRLAVPA